MGRVKALLLGLLASLLVFFNISGTAFANPVVSITSPTTGDSISGSSFTVTGTATANTPVQVSINGTLIDTVTSDGGGNWTLDVTGQSVGSKTISAKAIGDTFLYSAKGYGGTEEYIFDLATDTQVAGSPITPSVALNSTLSVVSPDGSKIYYININSSDILVFDTNTQDNSVFLSTGAVSVSGIAISSDDSTLYVSDPNTNSVYVIDIGSATITDTIALVGTVPQQLVLSPDDSTLYVTSSFDPSIDVVDTSSNTVTDTITLPSANISVIVNSTGSTVYVGSNASPSDIFVIDTATNTHTDTVAVGISANDMALLPDDSKLYVVNAFDSSPEGTVSVIDTSTNTVTSTVNVGWLPVGVDNTSDGSSVYVLCVGNLFGDGTAAGIWKIDTSDDSVTNILSGVAADGNSTMGRFIAQQTSTDSITITLTASTADSDSDEDLADTGSDIRALQTIASLLIFAGFALILRKASPAK